MPVGEPTDVERVVVATHGHCFDGAASAALFTRMLSFALPKNRTFSYRACGYGPRRGPLRADVLAGDVNAVLDYRYTQEPALHWYFDHHPTSFMDPGDREHFDANADGKRFHDPTYGSCTKLIADVARERFGFADPSLDDLVRWAEIIDTAGFTSAEEAIARDHPALHLMTVLEHNGDSAMLNRLVPALASRPLLEVATGRSVSRRWRTLERHHREFVQRVRERSIPKGAVVFADLSDEVREIVGKFVTYALFPACPYSVVLSRGHSKIKISVGFNPWSPSPRAHDISSLCARFGGGGHAVVGAVALTTDELERAREIAAEIVDALNR